MAMTPGDLSLDHLLDSRAMRNQATRVERHGQQALLCVPLRKRWFHRPPLSWLLPIREQRLIALDPIGTQVYDLCDGRPVEALIEAFASTHQLTFHAARLSVAPFLAKLQERRLIALEVPAGVAGS